MKSHVQGGFLPHVPSPHWASMPLLCYECSRPPLRLASPLTTDVSTWLPQGTAPFACSREPAAPPGPHVRTEDSSHRLSQARTQRPGPASQGSRPADFTGLCL